MEPDKRIQSSWRLVYLLASGIALISCQSDDNPLPLAPLVPSDLIVFSSERDGDHDIYIMNSDGTDERPLTDTSSHETQPRWSPDGSRIAYVMGGQIYVMNGDGTGQTRISSGLFDDQAPSWSPDGSKIVFFSDRDANPDFTPDIYVMGADGSGEIALTSNTTIDYFPSWSSDGSKIAFASDRDGNDEIYVMNADGSDQTRITNWPWQDTQPSWSQDGSEIVFTRGSSNFETNIWIMSSNGGGAVQLTDEAGFSAEQPGWSPDGTRIAYMSTGNGNGGLYAMNADRSDLPKQLTSEGGDDTSPSWGRRYSPRR
jgi:Tol biopolymer transport system component